MKKKKDVTPQNTDSFTEEMSNANTTEELEKAGEAEQADEAEQTDETKQADEAEQTDETKQADEAEQTDDLEKADEKEEASNKYNKSVILGEVLLALFAVAIICFAIVKSTKSEEEATASNNMVTENLSENLLPSPTAIDNSILFTDVPAVPSVDSFNTAPLSTYEEAVDTGNMLALTTEAGDTVYLNNYKDPEILKASIVYTEEEVNEFIQEDLLYSYMELVPADHDVAQNGDTVSVNYVGKIDGVAFDGGTADDMIELGAGNYIPGFEEGIVGMKEGDVKDITVTFPEDYHATDLAGKDAVFTITLYEVLTTGYPELTDELVASTFSDITTAEECYAYYEDLIIQEKLWTFLAKDFYVTNIPEEIIQEYYINTMNMYDSTSNMYQVSAIDMISGTYSSIDDFKLDVMDASAETSRYSVLYLALIKDLGITITDQDIAELATAYNYDDNEVFLDSYGQQIVYDYLYQVRILETLSAQVKELL